MRDFGLILQRPSEWTAHAGVNISSSRPVVTFGLPDPLHHLHSAWSLSLPSALESIHLGLACTLHLPPPAIVIRALAWHGFGLRSGTLS